VSHLVAVNQNATALKCGAPRALSRLLPTPNFHPPIAPIADGTADAPEAVPQVKTQMPVGESITRGALALLTTQPLTWASSLVTTIAVPRLLGAEALGQFTITFTIMNLASTGTSLGVSEYLVRRSAQSPTTLRQDVGVALLLQTSITILGAVILAVLTSFGVFSLVDARLLYIGLLAMLNVPVQTVLLSTFRGREMHRQYAWFNAIGGVAPQVGGVLALLAGADVLMYAAITGLALIATTFIGWTLSGLRPTLPPWGPALVSECRRFIWGGFPFLTWMLTLAVTGGADRVILGFFVPVAEVGWYAAAYRIFIIPVFIPNLIMTPLFPALSRSVHAYDTIRRTIAKTLRIVLLLMVPMTAGIVVVAPAIPTVLGWPADFENAVPLMVILSLQLPILAVDMVFGAVLLAIGRQGPWVTVGVATTLCKLLIDVLVIPVFENIAGDGAIGASLVSLLAEFAMFGGALILIPKTLVDVRVAWDAVRITIAGAGTVIVGTALMPVALVLAIAGGAVTYVATVVVLRALTLDDIRPLSDRWRAALPRRA
jgi:O-antigen/teichoic acid export membrane protein